MTPLHRLLIAGTSALLLAGCAHRAADVGLAGEVAIDSLSATRTAILRVDNASTSIVRIYMKMPGMNPSYVAKAMPGQARSWVLDPQMFPASSVSFEARVEDEPTVASAAVSVNRNETIELVVPEDRRTLRATVHKSTP